MAALTIALLGASPDKVQQLEKSLNCALNAYSWQAVLALPGNSPMNAKAFSAFDLVLVTGLQAAAVFRTEVPDLGLEAEDFAIRARLALAAVSYRVLYGTIEEQVAHALNAIESLLPRAQASTRRPCHSDDAKKQPWIWMCDKCSDPQCEHRLLTALLAQRTGKD